MYKAKDVTALCGEAEGLDKKARSYSRQAAILNIVEDLAKRDKITACERKENELIIKFLPKGEIRIGFYEGGCYSVKKEVVEEIERIVKRWGGEGV